MKTGAVDYAALYGAAYPGHADGASSFPRAAPAVIRSLVRRLGCTGVADVGAGNGILARLLAMAGVPCCSFDFRAAEAAGVMHFDLTRSDSEPQKRAIATAAECATGQYLTCCLDVLEHIGRGDIPCSASHPRRGTLPDEVS